jgi:hypothetical protein
MATVDDSGQTCETPNGWGVLLAVAAGWGITLRVALLMVIASAAVVALAIYLGGPGMAAIASAALGLGVRRTVKQRRRVAGTRRVGRTSARQGLN